MREESPLGGGRGETQQTEEAEDQKAAWARADKGHERERERERGCQERAKFLLRERERERERERAKLERDLELLRAREGSSIRLEFRAQILLLPRWGRNSIIL
jgi:hypothetical protein